MEQPSEHSGVASGVIMPLIETMLVNNTLWRVVWLYKDVDDSGHPLPKRLTQTKIRRNELTGLLNMTFNLRAIICSFCEQIALPKEKKVCN